MNVINIHSKAHLQNFSESCQKLAYELLKFDINIEAQSEEGLKRAQSLGPKIVPISKYIMNEVNRLAQITEITPSKESEVQNLWAFFKSVGFKFSKDLFGNLDKNHVIEVYDSSFKALYRNPNFYRNTSYTIDELHLFEWPELFYREQAITDQIAEAVGKAFGSDLETIVNFNTKKHFVKELFSRKKLTAEMQADIVAPLELDQNRAVVTAVKLNSVESYLTEV